MPIDPARFSPAVFDRPVLFSLAAFYAALTGPLTVQGDVDSRRNGALGNVEHQVLANHFPGRNCDRDRSGCASISEDTRDRILTGI